MSETKRPEFPDRGPLDLDPVDWEAFRARAHGALDAMIDHIRDVRERPVWRPASEEAKAFFAARRR